MTTEEHLKKIKAKCESLLAIAEKRTPGKWTSWPMHWAGGSASFKYEEENCPWINANEKSDIARVNPFGAYANSESMANAAFIASCAGSAEAGWRATIAAIDALLALTKNEKGWRGDNGTAGCAIHHHAWPALNDIITAWPEELL